ncbi:uncharacterized protein P884DRAFT_248861 [Thermothelomyces heterothallicus CBS 202.75]|uniref:uncharacterized protein n=1 Tax=Thermothelomyces heterothallicus CBS 202.75 TaxID=1149848 RepID=UPI0037420C4F
MAEVGRDEGHDPFAQVPQQRSDGVYNTHEDAEPESVDYSPFSFVGTESTSGTRSPGRRDKGKAEEILAVDFENNTCPLISLPVELLGSILTYLAPEDLCRVSGTCRTLYAHATDDRLWRSHVQDNVPGQEVTSSYPFASFRELYAALDPHWFVTKYKFWFSDTGLPGRMIVARYDQRRGCIEGYQLLAHNQNSSFHTWHAHGDTILSSFNPKVKLHLDNPVLRLPARLPNNHDNDSEGIVVLRPNHKDTDVPDGDGSGTSGTSSSGTGTGSGKPNGLDQQARANRFQSSILMYTNASSLQNSFIYARSLSPDDMAERASSHFPYGHIWPPPTIPSPHRVLGAGLERHTSLRDRDRAHSRREVYDRAFRIHKCIHVNNLDDYIAAPGILPINWPPFGHQWLLQLDQAVHRANPLAAARVPLGEEVSTYATLDPARYTPTPTKPWRGIWVGDYGAHGCEFLWIHQPDDDDDDPDDPSPAAVERPEDESDEAYAARRRDAAVYRGRLEAVKLTGDANVPRGEVSFVVDDLGPGGLIRTETAAPFEGARVVSSRGHIANNGFSSHTYVDSELFLISSDLLAHNWLALGHISYFKRVDIDSLIVPE